MKIFGTWEDPEVIWFFILIGVCWGLIFYVETLIPQVVNYYLNFVIVNSIAVYCLRVSLSFICLVGVSIIILVMIDIWQAVGKGMSNE